MQKHRSGAEDRGQVGLPIGLLALVLVSALLVVVGAAAASGAERGVVSYSGTTDQFGVRSVASRPEAVTGNNALLEINVPAAADPADVAITVDGVNARSSFSPVAGQPRLLRGEVNGLDLGSNTVLAKLAGYPNSTLYLVDHSTKGPLFSGKPEAPFYCRTQENQLGNPLDADCSATTQVTYTYRTTADVWKTLANPSASYPVDGQMTTTSDGKTVPFAVRTERGTLDRGVYTLSALTDVGPGSDHSAPGVGWNKKMSYFFGPNCSGGFNQGTQVDPTRNGIAGDSNSVMNLGKGYAIGRSTLNVFGNRCFDAVSAEALSMVKERFMEWAGQPIQATFGYGNSGGSTAQQMIGNNYPGLLDGLHLGRSFTDNTNADAVEDCGVVNHFLQGPGGSGWTTEQAQAVRGGGIPQSCPVAFASFSRVLFDPTFFCPPETPPASEYDEQTNPGGLRCNVFDANKAVWGIDPATGVARQPVDNIGEQYGLDALSDGTITPAQFLALNQDAGGVTINGAFQAQRRTSSTQTLRIAYQSGEVNEGGAGLAYTPIIDNRGYQDDTEPNIHSTTHALSMRARLVNANGGVGPQVIFTSPNAVNYSYVNDLLDDWVTNIQNDDSDRSQRAKAIAGEPADATDSCFANGDQSSLIARETASYNSGTCGTTYPSPKVTGDLAGGSSANDVIKCELKPIDFSSYGVASFSSAQRAQLQSIFPDGVCDYSKPGVEQTISPATWRALPTSDVPDTSAPNTAINSRPKAEGAGTAVRFDFSSTETGSQYRCSLDGAPFKHCDPIDLESGSGSGQHTFKVRAFDAAGNGDPSPASASFYVGNKPNGRARLKLLTSKTHVGKSGRFELSGRCKSSAVDHCKGKISVTARYRNLTRPARPGRAVVARKSYVIGKGKHRISLKLNGRGRRAIRKHDKLGVRVSFSVKQPGDSKQSKLRYVKLVG